MCLDLYCISEMMIPSIKWLNLKINCKDLHKCDLYFFVDDSKHVVVEFKLVNENHVFLYTSSNNINYIIDFFAVSLPWSIAEIWNR